MLFRHGRVYTKLRLLQIIQNRNLVHTIAGLTQVATAHPALSATEILRLGEVNGGSTPADLIAQVTNIAGNNITHLIQLYNDGATAAQINALLNHENNGATLHAQIQAIAGNNVAHLVQLYADGATSAQITTLLPLENNGATLHTYMPLILRQVADGLPINQNMIDRVERQLGTVTALEGIQGANAGQNLVWGQQQMDLLGTAFGRWLLAAGPEPNPQTGNMNCWEVVLFGAYRAGYVNFAWLQNFYQQFANDLAAGNLTYIENNLAVGARRTHNPAAVAPLMPLRGDVVIFQQAVAHTAIATGNLRAGSPEVLSLWNTPNNHLYLQVVSVDDLLGVGASQPVEFFSPNWT